MRLLRARIPTMDTRRVKPLGPPLKVANPYYMSREHRDWAAQVIALAGAKCQGCGRTDRLYADHIIELKDGGAPTDLANGQALCPSCHSLKTAMVKRNRPHGSTHPEWMRPSRVPLTIVCGPPASGKTTWAKGRMRQGDQLIDLDVIASRLSGLSLHAWGREWLDPALRERNAALGKLSWKGTGCAYLTIGEPTADKREWWARKLKPQAIVVCETPAFVCHSRIDRDPDRADRCGEFVNRVDAWWRTYSRRPADTIVRPYDASETQDRIVRCRCA